jgi:hypothetical protein
MTVRVPIEACQGLIEVFRHPRTCGLDPNIVGGIATWWSAVRVPGEAISNRGAAVMGSLLSNWSRALAPILLPQRWMRWKVHVDTCTGPSRAVLYRGSMHFADEQQQCGPN